MPSLNFAHNGGDDGEFYQIDDNKRDEHYNVDNKLNIWW